MTNSSKEELTLYAAAISAVVSFLSLIINLFNQRRTELRAAQRKSLDESVHILGEHIHSTIATSSILLKARTDESIRNWRDRANDAKVSLKNIRPKTRYSLWGITESINTLTRLPDWVEHARNYPDHSNAIFSAGRSLGKSLDSVIRKCYLQGRPPRIHERVYVAYRSWYLEHRYRKFQATSKSKKTSG